MTSSHAALLSRSTADWTSTGVGHDCEPLARVAVRGQHRRRPVVALDADLVDVGGLGGVERLKSEVDDLGLAHVMVGEVAEGLALVDEAMAGTLGGEYRRLDTVAFATCDMLAACHLVGDLDWATQWCKVAEDFMVTYGCPFLYARCRSHYGGVLVAKGRWEQAEHELRAAIDMSVQAIALLADLRLRQGRLEEAEALLALADDSTDIALAAAAVRLARGEPAVAAGMLARRVNLLGKRHIETAATLAMLVDAHLGDGDLDAATEAVSRLRAIAELQERGPAAALATLAEARVAVARGRQGVALHFTINVAQPRPLLSDNKVVEMRRRPNAQSVLRASPRCAV